jgi:sterol desaturase/sphingolipid hydroxylase (fatty acid hydroxylase superfamily)
MPVLITVFLVGLVTFHLLERVAPIHTGYTTGPRRRAYWADCVATIVNGPGMAALTKIGAAWLVLCLPIQNDLMTRWPWTLQFAVFFLVNDFARYWLHRAYHASDVLWRIHRVHHTVIEMDALSTFRVHLLEAVIKYGVIILPFRLVGIDDAAIILYSSLDVLKGFWHHANLRTYIGPLNKVLNSAELHWWHHSIERRGHRSNYGSILSIWDRLFGTFYWPRGTWPDQIGVRGIEQFPDSYLGQLASIRHNDDAMRGIKPTIAPTVSASEPTTA